MAGASFSLGFGLFGTCRLACAAPGMNPGNVLPLGADGAAGAGPLLSFLLSDRRLPDGGSPLLSILFSDERLGGLF